MWNALVTRKKGVRGIYSLRSWSAQIKYFSLGKNSNPNYKTHTHRPLQQNHNSTTAWETGERASKQKSKSARERMREQQEQTHSLIKGGSLKISQETLLFLFCSEVNKSVVSPEISEPNVFSIQLSKKYFSLIIKMHNYCRWKKVSHLPQIICFNMTIMSSPTQPFTWNSYFFFFVKKKPQKDLLSKVAFFMLEF